MKTPSNERPSPPAVPMLLGYAGLLPQALAVAVLATGPPTWRVAALWLGGAYAALILSFLGGMWWGLAARADRPSGWLWLAAVIPSLVALAAALPVVFGVSPPSVSLLALAAALLASLLVDRRLVAGVDAPAWWMALRVPLSVGLALLTLAMAAQS